MLIDRYIIPILIAKVYVRLVGNVFSNTYSKSLMKLIFLVRNVLPNRKILNDESVQTAWKYLESISSNSGESCIKKVTSCRMEKYDLHIIIPVFNGERYIQKCLESIVTQRTDYSIFITVVDDGSTDGTAYILKSFSLKYDNVEIITQVNAGHSGARNSGLRRLYGRYLMFVDSDDELVDNAVQTLMSKAEQTGEDIIGGGYYTIAETGELLSTYIPSDSKQHGFPWGKIYKSYLFERIEFPMNYWFEDTVIGMIILPLSNSQANIKNPVYRYRINSQGITSTAAGQPKVLDSIYITQRLLNDREKLGIKMMPDFYDSLLFQIRMNQWRAWTLRNRAIDKALFNVSSKLIENYPEYYTSNRHLQLLEWSLRNQSFIFFLMACV